MSEEMWKVIPDFPGYEVSSNGRVRSYKKRVGMEWKIMPTPQRVLAPGGKRYKMVNLCHDGKQNARKIAHLVLLAFVGPCPEGMEICHNDGDSFNDNLKNLRYDTRHENMADILRYGNRKLNDESAIIDIRMKYKRGTNSPTLAREYGIDTSTVLYICKGKSYPTIGGPIASAGETRGKKLCKQDVIEIRQLRKTGMMLKAIGEIYGVSESHVSRICSGKYWRI